MLFSFCAIVMADDNSVSISNNAAICCPSLWIFMALV